MNNSFHLIIYRKEMSSSDYTNLRRIRHVYQPTMSSCHPNVQPQVVYTTPSESNCYVGTYPTHNHVPSYPNVHSHYSPAPTPHYVHPPHVHPCHVYPSHVHPSYVHPSHVHPSHVHHHDHHDHFTCHPEEHVHNDNHEHDADHSHPCHCTDHVHGSNPHHVHHTHETVVVHRNHPEYLPTHSHGVVSTHSHSGHLPHMHTVGSFSSKYQYLITPVVNGSITFSVDPNLHFTKDMRVTITSDVSNNNYIEGSVYYYNPCNGEITIYKISTINGSFTAPSKYTISFGTPYQEIDKLKLKVAELHEQVFGSSSGTGSTLTETELQALGERVTNLYIYFFNDDISSTDSMYKLTESYLSGKMNSLYNYFFDVNLSLNSTFNPNNNCIVMDTLTIKVDQLYLYFFGTINSTIIN